MGDELSRLASYEAECHRKDVVIAALRDEVADLKGAFQSNGGFRYTLREIIGIVPYSGHTQSVKEGPCNDHYKKLDHCIMKFKGFDCLSGLGFYLMTGPVGNS